MIIIEDEEESPRGISGNHREMGRQSKSSVSYAPDRISLANSVTDKRALSSGAGTQSVASFVSQGPPRTYTISARTMVPPRCSGQGQSHAVNRTFTSLAQNQTAIRSSLPSPASSAQTRTGLRPTLPTSTPSTQAQTALRPSLLASLRPAGTAVSSLSSNTTPTKQQQQMSRPFSGSFAGTNTVVSSTSSSSVMGRGPTLSQARPSSVVYSSQSQVGIKRTLTGKPVPSQIGRPLVSQTSKPVTIEGSPPKTATTIASTGRLLSSSVAVSKSFSPPSVSASEKQNQDKVSPKTTPAKTPTLSSSGFRPFTTASSPKSSALAINTSPLSKTKVSPVVTQSLGDLTFSYASSIPNYSSYWPQTPTVPVAKKHTNGAVTKSTESPATSTKSPALSTASAGVRTSIVRPDGRTYQIGSMGSLTAISTTSPGTAISKPTFSKTLVSSEASVTTNSEPLVTVSSSIASTSMPLQSLLDTVESGIMEEVGTKAGTQVGPVETSQEDTKLELESGNESKKKERLVITRFLLSTSFLILFDGFFFGNFQLFHREDYSSLSDAHNMK